MRLEIADAAFYDAQMAAVRTRLTPAHFTAAWAAGQALPIAAAIAEAQAIARAAAPPA
jgi:hypothetical protein